MSIARRGMTGLVTGGSLSRGSEGIIASGVRWTLRSVAGASAVALLAMASVVTVIAQPASAQTPTVVVTPDVVAGNDPVEVEFSGFAEGPGGFGSYTTVLICAADVVGATTVHPTRCSPEGGQAGPGLPSGSFEVRPYGTFGDVNCATVEGGCVIGVVHIVNQNEIVAQAWGSISFYPTLRVEPQVHLDDGDTVTVTATVVPPGEWQLAQCGRAYLDDPTPARAAQLCGPSVTVSADAGARFSSDLVVRDPLVPTAPGAAPVPCGLEGCVVVGSNESVPVAHSHELSFGQIVFASTTVTPNSGLAAVATVEVTVENWPLERGGQAQVAQCAYPPGAPTPPALAQSACGQVASMVIDDSGTGRTTLQVRGFLPIVPRPQAPFSGFVDCRVIGCAVMVFDITGDHVSGWGTLGFASPPLTVTPNQRVLDGEAMTVSTSGLTPGQYRLDYCQSPRVPTGTFTCAQGEPVSVGANGSLNVQVPARQRFTSTTGTREYCRAGCMLRLWSVAGSTYVAQHSYIMASGNVTLSPYEGLTNGQAVQVTGNQLMRSYSGPTFGGIRSGQWYVAQCNRNLAFLPAPYGLSGEEYMWALLLNCSVYPPGTPVTVSGSTLQTTLNVRATITNAWLQTTDCTVSPGGCYAGLVRLEQDGSLTARMEPLIFGP